MGLTGAKLPEDWDDGNKDENKKADLRRLFYCLKSGGLLLHCVSVGRSRSGSSDRCRGRGSIWCSDRSRSSRGNNNCNSRSFSSLLAAGGQSKSQQSSNKSNTFHFVFLESLKLKYTNFPDF
jgi:hypothetical protein